MKILSDIPSTKTLREFRPTESRIFVPEKLTTAEVQRKVTSISSKTGIPFTQKRLLLVAGDGSEVKNVVLVRRGEDA